jgi:hypothetical protein
MDQNQKILAPLPHERSRILRVLVIGTWDMGKAHGEEAQMADVILMPIGEGDYRIVKARRNVSGSIISAELMAILFGIH